MRPGNNIKNEYCMTLHTGTISLHKTYHHYVSMKANTIEFQSDNLIMWPNQSNSTFVNESTVVRLFYHLFIYKTEIPLHHMTSILEFTVT